jgi:hypothetical protein
MNNLFWITVGLIYVIPLVDREETEDTVENGEVTPLKISSQ